MKRVALLAIILLSLPCWAQYSIKSVDCTGVNFTRLYSINNSGLMVGSYRFPGSPQHAMIYRNGTCQGLEEWLGSGYSAATGVNASGVVTGAYSNEFGLHGFILKDGALTTLDYPGADETWPQAISDSGVVVGYYLSPIDLSGHGFVYRDGTFYPLDVSFAGMVDTVPAGINARGDISGDWDTDPTTLGHGFIRTKDGVETSFDVPGAPENGTYLAGINDRGDVVGCFGLWGQPTDGFVVLRNTLIIVPKPEGGTIVPNAINNKGLIVGTMRDADGVHGFVGVPDKMNVE